MKLDEILHSVGKRRGRKRLGRGIGSGLGKTCGRGHKGAGARAGSTSGWGAEGGQTPALSRIPKRGFSNYNFRKEFQIVNVGLLERFKSGSRVDSAVLADAGLIGNAAGAVKILGNGELTKKLTVVASKASASAVAKISQAGGTFEPIAKSVSAGGDRD